MMNGANVNVSIAAKIELKNVTFLVFLNPLSSLFPSSLAKIGKTAAEENAIIVEAAAIRLNAAW